MSETVTAPQSNSVPQQPEPPRAAEPGRTWKLGLIVMVLLTAAAVVVWRLFFFGPGLPNNIVALSGRIEGDDSAIAPKTGGRILEVRFREGDSVAAGEIIARLSDEQIVARDDQARAGVSVAEAAHKSAQDQIAVLQEQLRQNQIQTAQSKVDAEGRVNQAQAELAAAEADLAQQQAAYQLASFDQDAYTRLAQTGAASERQAKQAVATAGQQAAAVAAAQRRVTA